MTQFTAVRPNQRWVGDTTELITGNGRLFLAVILDLFSRFVVGWALSPVNDRHLTIEALENAILRRCPEVGLLHHSDQGCTYASEDYQRRLSERGIVCSMEPEGRGAGQRAAMESWNSTFKVECGERFATNDVAHREVFDYVEVFYNQQRRHSALGFMSPAEYERSAQMQFVSTCPPNWIRPNGMVSGFTARSRR